MAMVMLMLFAGHCVYAEGSGTSQSKSTRSLQLVDEAVTKAAIMCGEMVTTKKA